MNDKASANIWWIIIGAVMALVVLIVIIVIFTGRTATLNEGLGDCRSKGGICMPPGVACPSGTLGANSFSCGESGNCCVGVPKTCTNSGDCQVCVPDVDRTNWCV